LTGLLVAALVLAAASLLFPLSASRLRLRAGRPALDGRRRPSGVAWRAHRERRPDEALVLDLLAAALTAGTPPEHAMSAVASAVGGQAGHALDRVASRLRLGGAWDAAWADAPDTLDAVARALGLAVTTGAPTAELLRAAASDLRRRRHRQAQAAASRLAVRLVLPLGLCALPAFVAWAVVPVVLSLAGRVLGE
jgi:Flp pilus assembly protein TadB